eukprot:1147347-Pelagomonas_calceolata.AAC.3
MEALHELLNNPLTLELHDTPTSALLATAVLDLLPFGLGTLADWRAQILEIQLLHFTAFVPACTLDAAKDVL